MHTTRKLSGSWNSFYNVTIEVYTVSSRYNEIALFEPFRFLTFRSHSAHSLFTEILPITKSSFRPDYFVTTRVYCIEKYFIRVSHVATRVYTPSKSRRNELYTHIVRSPEGEGAIHGSAMLLRLDAGELGGVGPLAASSGGSCFTRTEHNRSRLASRPCTPLLTPPVAGQHSCWSRRRW